MRGSPVKVKVPSEAANAAHSGRMAVPAFPRNRVIGSEARKGPPSPWTTHAVRCSASCRSTPNNASASSIYRMSSLSSRLLTRVSPSANAASNRIRLDRLFEPGRLTVPEMRVLGCSVKLCISQRSRGEPRDPGEQNADHDTRPLAVYRHSMEPNYSRNASESKPARHAARTVSASACSRAPSRCLHTFSWKKYTTVLTAGSTSATAPPTMTLPVSAQATKNAVVIWTTAKLAVFLISFITLSLLHIGDDHLGMSKPSHDLSRDLNRHA